MHGSHNRYFTRITHDCQILFVHIGAVVLVSFLFACSSIPSPHRERQLVVENGQPVQYSMVFIIHGDGDYLYHDTRGQAYRADEEALIGATRVAMDNPQAEVFIFHERPRQYALLFFPLRDGAFYYYRYGQLVIKENYWRNQGSSRFDPEVALYNRFKAVEQPKSVKLFFYFGHEIPEFDGKGYDASNKQQEFTVDDLADGLKRILSDNQKYDLLVLSTCFNGTPHTIATFAPYARTIVASPGNIHLSYFDLQSFERLDVKLRERDMDSFAMMFAHQSFDRLAKEIQTAITIAVYDTDRVWEYVTSVESVYEHALTELNGLTPGYIEHCDCAEEPAYILQGMSEGVDIFYRPAQFGRSKRKQDHSGWECWRLIESRAAASH